MLLFGILLIIIIIVIVILFLIFYDFKIIENYAVDTYLTAYPTTEAAALSSNIAMVSGLNNQLKDDIDNIDIYSEDKEKNILLLMANIGEDAGGKYAIISKLKDIYYKYLELFDISNFDTDYNIIPMINFNFSQNYVVDDDLINIEKYLENNVYNNNLSPLEYIKNIPKTSLIYSADTPVTPVTPVTSATSENKKPEDVTVFDIATDRSINALASSAIFLEN